MLYTDGVHLIADSLDELHGYANKIGLKRGWFESHWRHPHYDIVNQNHQSFKGKREIVMNDESVKKVSKREIVKLCRVRYCFPQNERELEEWNRYNNPEAFMDEEVLRTTMKYIDDQVFEEEAVFDHSELVLIKKQRDENRKSVGMLSEDEERALQGGADSPKATREQT